MTSIELKNLRLEREQTALVDLIGRLNDNVSLLVQYTDMDLLSNEEVVIIMDNQLKSIQVMSDVLNGK